MSAILGGLVGLGGSLAPSIVEYFNKKQDLSHQREIKRMELDAAKLGHEFNLQIENIRAESSEVTALLQHDASLQVHTDAGWGALLMDMLRASVRPVITYAFFALFLCVKLSGLYIAWYVQKVPLAPALIALWDPDTASLFAAIMGFWFGQRAINRFGFGAGRVPTTTPVRVTIPAKSVPASK